MAAPGVGCMIAGGRAALGLDPGAPRAPWGLGDAPPKDLPRREDDGSNHRKPDERAHRRERMRDCEHAIVEVAPGPGKLYRPGMGPGVARLAADEAEAAVSACEALRIPTLRALLRLVAAAAALIPCRLECHFALAPHQAPAIRLEILGNVPLAPIVAALLDRHSLGALPVLLHAAVQDHVDDLLAADMREGCVPRRFRARNDEEHLGHKLPPRVKRPPIQTVDRRSREVRPRRRVIVPRIEVALTPFP